MGNEVMQHVAGNREILIARDPKSVGCGLYETAKRLAKKLEIFNARREKLSNSEEKTKSSCELRLINIRGSMEFCQRKNRCVSCDVCTKRRA